MGFLSWIFFGFIVGLIAKAIRPGKDPQGCLTTVVIGVVGALIGGWIGKELGFGSITGFNIKSMLIAILGAVLLLWGISTLKRDK